MRSDSIGIPVALASMLMLFTAVAQAGIEWRNYDAAAFADARKLDRPIIVNVGHEGCTACRNMEENTFQDPRVIELINASFVGIQVDSEMQPDIGERYSDWAWPATAFLKPDATQVFAIRGSRRADDFLALLKQVLKRHRAGELKRDQLVPYTAPTTLRDGPLEAIRRQVRAQLDGSFDDQQGGWGEAKVLEYAEPTLQLFWRGHLYRDPQARERALKTARGFLRQLDPVWGGMFYASFGRWDHVVREKRLESQAAALQLFADALQVSGDPAFAEGIENVHRYLNDWMTAANGMFYANQKDVGPRLSEELDIDAYYRLDDQGRRRYGVPLIDRAIYSDVNARVITGLVRAFEVTGKQAYLDSALGAANSLLTERKTDAGWVAQFAADAGLEKHPRVHQVRVTGQAYLRTQVHVGLAALALYQATTDERWRTLAFETYRGMNEVLADPQLGGFFASPASDIDDIVGRRKSLEDNAAAARLIYWLGVLSHDEHLSQVAIDTVRAVASREIVAREGRVTGSLALTLELLIAGYVEFSVVGEGAAGLTLLDAGREVYEPRRLLHFEAPGRYPKRPQSSMYICNDQQCSVPITKADEVAKQAAQFVPAQIATGGRQRAQDR